jgi:hypothetical protein
MKDGVSRHSSMNTNPMPLFAKQAMKAIATKCTCNVLHLFFFQMPLHISIVFFQMPLHISIVR